MRTFRLTAIVLAAGMASSAIAAPATQTAIFAGGCFWSMESGMEHVPGVISAVSGYTGGPEKNPTYKQVSSETTGHLEAVKVTYDPAKISYRQLVDAYFHQIDPTDSGGTFCDRGPSYRSAVFVANDAQRKDAVSVIAALQAGPFKGRKIYTPVRAAEAFWPAEAYHQDFAKKNKAHYEAYKIGCRRVASLNAAWKPR